MLLALVIGKLRGKHPRLGCNAASWKEKRFGRQRIGRLLSRRSLRRASYSLRHHAKICKTRGKASVIRVSTDGYAAGSKANSIISLRVSQEHDAAKCRLKCCPGAQRLSIATIYCMRFHPCVRTNTFRLSSWRLRIVHIFAVLWKPRY